MEAMLFQLVFFVLFAGYIFINLDSRFDKKPVQKKTKPTVRSEKKVSSQTSYHCSPGKYTVTTVQK